MLTCWFHRLGIDRSLDEDRPLPNRLHRHLAQCPECRAYHHTHANLIAAMAKEALAPRPASPPFLEGRILAAIQRADRAPVPRRLSLAWSSVLATVSLVVLGVAVALNSLPHRAHPAQPRPLASSSSSTRPLPQTATLPTGGELMQWTRGLDQPLEKEAALVMDDARTAVHLLATSFLPTGAFDSLPGIPGQ